MTYLSHTNAHDAMTYSKWVTGFGMTQELFITGCVGLTKQRRRTHERRMAITRSRGSGGR